MAREYHYAMTLQCPNPSRTGVQADTYQGVMWMDWDDRRQIAYRQVFTDGCAELGFPPDKTYVLFWSLEPNHPGA